MIESTSFWTGLRMELLTFTGSQDSSSHKLSWLVLFRIMPEKKPLPSISLISISTSRIKLPIQILKKSQRMDVYSMVFSLKDASGITRHQHLLSLTQRSFSLTCLSFIWFQLLRELNHRQVSMNAQFTRFWAEQVLYPPQVIPLTSSCGSKFHPRKLKTFGLEQVLPHSCL